MRSEKRWVVWPAIDAGAFGSPAVSPLILQLLANRRITAPADIEAFLSPKLTDLPPPESLPGCTEAADRIAAAIRAKRKIVVYGDYDVDGISGTAILWHAIKLAGGEVGYYVPHRLEEGYGLNCEALAAIKAGGASMVVTVDCGITAIEPAQAARALGLELIITDHHDLPGPPSRPGLSDGASGADETGSRGGAGGAGGAGGESGEGSEGSGGSLPAAACVVHPRLSGPIADRGSRIADWSTDDSNPKSKIQDPKSEIRNPKSPPSAYPNPDLCGAGVALKVAWALGQKLSPGKRVSEPFRKFLLAGVSLAALATIADVAPLRGENRVLATFGLRSIKRTGLVGLDALIESAGLADEKVDAYHAGFALAPRLNAAGRMDAARQVVEMFTEAGAARCRELAEGLERHNRDRQQTERAILRSAVERLEADPDFAERYSIVLADESWHPGVVGIVASRLVDRYHRPTVLVGVQNGLGQGSARSVDLPGGGFHVGRALAACAEHLVSFGGHAMAGGLRLEAARFERFAEAFERYARANLRPQDRQPVLRIDAEVEPADLDLASVRQIAALAPFGVGNPRPVLACRGCMLSGPPRRVGRDGAHLQMFVRIRDRLFKAVAFNAAELAAPLASSPKFDLAFEPTINEYQGRVTVELNIRDVRFV